jgi:multiple sugar transport system substrate-binding protein
MAACSEAWTRLHPELRVTWDARSLLALGDQPIEEVASAYDIVMIDHPFCGSATAAGLLRPFDELVRREELAVLEADAVGPSHSSYTVDGRQWALAADAASHVSALRADLRERAPATWDEALALAAELSPHVAVPLAPAHAISAFLTLCANGGSPVAAEDEHLVDPAVGEWAIDVLRRFHALGPVEAVRWEPPDVLALLTDRSDQIAYVPLTYAYVTYATDAAVARSCRFVDIPSAGAGPVGGILGGVGFAITAASQHPAEAAAFCLWASGAEVQRTIVGTSGGQPASRSAWVDPDLNLAAHGFYADTLATIERAWVRPRARWWPSLQLEGGRLLAAALEQRVPAAATLTRLDALYRARLTC